jgi:CRISPR-associated endoribonuclease Cas6
MVFGLTLIGRAIDYLPYFIYTFEELGKTGLGKGRGRFELKTVVNHVPGVEGKAVDRIIYSSTTKMLSDFQKVPLPLGTISFDDTTPETSRLTLNFLTPTRISHNGHLTDAIEFHMIVRNLMRRISLLAYFHGNGHGLPDLDFNEIIEKAKGVKVIRKRLRRYNWERYSGRQERRISMDGFVGSITFEGEIEPFMPMIKAGEVLHIGKGTVFGLGRYKVQQEH